MGFYLFEQEEVTRRYAGHVGPWNTVMFCSITKFWTDRTVLMLRWCWARQFPVRFLLTFPVIVNRKPSVLVKVLTQFSRIFFSLTSRYPNWTIEIFSQISATFETWIAFKVFGIYSLRHHGSLFREFLGPISQQQFSSIWNPNFMHFHSFLCSYIPPDNDRTVLSAAQRYTE